MPFLGPVILGFLLACLSACSGGVEDKPNPAPKKVTADNISHQLGLLLIDAAREGDLPRVNSLLTRGADIKTFDTNGESVLHAFFNRRNWKLEIDLLKLLLQNGAVLTAKDSQGRRPVHLAAERGRHKVMKFLLIKKVDLTATDNEGMTPLHLAAGRGNIETLVLMASAGAALNTKDHAGRTPLHLAQENKKHETACLLVSLGANLFIIDVYGNSPAAWLAESCAAQLNRQIRSDKIQDIDNLSKNICVTNKKLKAATLHYCATEGLVDVVRLLLKNKADIGFGGVFHLDFSTPGAEPLHGAAWGGHLEIVDMLLVSGADPNARDANGWTALHWSAWKNHPDVAKVLLKNGALATHIDKQGKTALDLVSAKNKLEWSSLLKP
ncbi:MAG: ankyrin repeat domain-containing protein [Deltaproteobacteria bacterium]|nr:ankyrin repeat domain-containing protein [Deltaproteobacteria bacterium]